MTNKVNSYTCKNGHVIATYDYNEGVIPFIMKCGTCGEHATSRFYDVDQTITINGIWHKPCKEEYDDLSLALQYHVDNGGLVYESIPTNLTVKDIEMYRNWAQTNHVKGDKIPVGTAHPIVVLECSKMNDVI